MIVQRTPSGLAPTLAIDVSPTPQGYVQLALSGGAAGLPNVPDGACKALIAVSGTAVRWRDDGQDPTASIGMPVRAGETFEYAGPVSALRFIGADATLDVALYR